MTNQTFRIAFSDRSISPLVRMKESFALVGIIFLQKLLPTTFK